jgi:histidyl-tRNA synthetase
MKSLSTQPYKGVRDFYPEDMAVQRYIFDVWSDTAESFGFERYDASVLEPSELYKSKGVENEEMVNDQTYTFVDRGEREVTLRPEMTPTVARMVAGKRNELTFPLRWYSIPNLFRYERMQKGRLREHWQLNCDIFGATNFTADVEIIALAHQMLLNFGADESMFSIRVNNREEMNQTYEVLGVKNKEKQQAITKLNDRFHKMDRKEYLKGLEEIVGDKKIAQEICDFISGAETFVENEVVAGLNALGINNVVVDRSIARGFNYYTGTVFEIFDTAPENNRSMLGGGRYDNLTGMFGGEAIAGVGFGMGDVTMRDFLETHNLLTASITAPTLLIIPTSDEQNLEAQKIAQGFRSAGVAVAVDFGSRKLGKKISSAADNLVEYVLVVGEDEIKNKKFTLKNLSEKSETTGSLAQLVKKLNK